MDEYVQSPTDHGGDRQQQTVADVLEVLRIIDVANGRFDKASVGHSYTNTDDQPEVVTTGT